MQLNNDDWVNPLNTKLAIISQWIYKAKEVIANSIDNWGYVVPMFQPIDTFHPHSYLSCEINNNQPSTC
jgi:hypothetical protein